MTSMKCLSQYIVISLGLIALIAIIVMSPFSLGSASAEDSVRLFGYVTDRDNVPVEDAWVTVFDENRVFLKNTQTDENGYYELIVPHYQSYNFFVEGRDPYRFNYIPVDKKVFVDKPADTQVDFRLRPGANIIIHAYDNDGNLLRNRDFREATIGKAFASDLNDMPHYAVYCRVQDSYSKSDWDLAVPAVIVLPQTPYKIHILWEVPGFGKVVLSADNEGKGYSVDRQGGLLTLNFNYEAAKSKIAMLQRDYDLLKSQGYNISSSAVEGLNLGNEHLRAAEKYLLQAPTPDMKSAVAELNLSLKHSLWAHERLYLDRAEADIEKYRKGAVKIRVVDEKGTPLDNCSISFKQTSHDFLFSVALSSHYSERKYVDLLKQAGINCIYVCFSYGVIQPEPGRFTFSSQDNQVNALLKDGFELIGNLLWLFYRAPWETNSGICPSYLDTMSFDEIKDNVYKYMYTVADRYKGKVDMWEAIYEPGFSFMNEFNWTWNQKFEIYGTAVRAIKDANPGARILFKGDENPSYAYFSSYKSDALDFDKKAEDIPSPELIRLAIEKQIPIDIIGMHLINSGVDVYVEPRHVHLALDLVSISALIDQYSKFDKPILFREHQAPSTQVEDSYWWHRPWDEQTQAEYVKDFYTLVFSKPLMDGIGWSTGFTDDETQKYGCLGGGLLYADLKPKQSYFALKNLINSWKTDVTGKTDGKGEFEFRGFAGDYEMSLETTEGQSFETLIHIYEQQTNEIIIEFPLDIQKEPKLIQSFKPEVEPSPEVAPVPEVEPSPKTTPIPEEVPSPGRINIPLIAGTIGGIVVLGLLTLFMIRKRAH